MSLTSKPVTKEYDAHFDETFPDKHLDPICTQCQQRAWKISFNAKSQRVITCKRCGYSMYESAPDFYVTEPSFMGYCPILPLTKVPVGPKGDGPAFRTFTSDKGYQAPWVPGERNIPFWREVFEGRTIDQVLFDDHGVSALKLDDGQIVRLVVVGGRATVSIQD